MPDIPIWTEGTDPATWKVYLRMTEKLYVENSPVTLEDALSDKLWMQNFFQMLKKLST